MALSQKIEDYFSVDLIMLKPKLPLYFDIHLFFSQNQHVMMWKKKNEVVTAEFIDRYFNRGQRKIWILNQDRKAYERYLQGDPDPDSKKIPPSPPKPKSHSGTVLKNVLQSKKIPPEEKKKIVSQAAKKILQECTDAKNLAEQKEANRRARKIIEDAIAAQLSQSLELLKDLWKMSGEEPMVEHASNVSTYTVIFSMSFGKISPELLSDLAMAGLLHDLGICKLPIQLTLKTWNAMTDSEKKEYESHVNRSLEIIQSFQPETSQRVKDIILQQHEKFNGSGYPRHLKGFDLDDVSQLLTISEMMETLCSGLYDGKKRTVQEGLSTIEKMNQNGNFPIHFNPDILGTILRWIRQPQAEKQFGGAKNVVREKSEDLI